MRFPALFIHIFIIKSSFNPHSVASEVHSLVRQRVPPPFGVKKLKEFPEEVVARERAGVADDDQLGFGPGDGLCADAANCVQRNG